MQADLGLRCPHMPADKFSLGVAHITRTFQMSERPGFNKNWTLVESTNHLSGIFLERYIGTNFICDLLVLAGLKPDLNVDGPLGKSDGLIVEQIANSCFIKVDPFPEGV